MESDSKAGTAAATSLVVASMIGTGVFTSLGYQLSDFQQAPVILLLWLLGGLSALCGALCYAELARLLPKSGGEYHYLGTLYHPALGLMSGLLSAIVGFAAPTALSAIALTGYLLTCFPDLPPKTTAIALILLGTTAHAFSSHTSARVQTAATLLKLLIILAFLVTAAVVPGKGDISWQWQGTTQALAHPAFATALLYVMYAYSGWNAAIYGLEDWKQPVKTVRRALIGGTLLVTLLYLALNSAFLHAAPVRDLRNVLQVGHVAALSLLGPSAAHTASLLLALGLFASISALLWAGPRVLNAMGKDLPALSFLHSPLRSLMFQSSLACLLVLVGNFSALIAYTQIGLTVASSLSVFGLFLIRHRFPNATPLQIPLNPLPQLFFLGTTAFVVIISLIKQTAPTVCGLLTTAFCALLWFPLRKKTP